MGRRVVGLAVVLLLAACASPSTLPAAPSPTPAATSKPPYDGPLDVAVSAPANDFDADRSGAAGLVVDCAGDPVGGYFETPFEGEVSSSADRALRKTLTEEPNGATEGYRQARAEGDRVLYTYTADDRIRQAYVIRQGRSVDGHDGWYPESWARCDWSELPDRWAAARGLQVWTDANGHRVPTTTISSQAGPQHCDWQEMIFLHLGEHTFVARPQAELYPDYFTVAYAEGERLPRRAVDTGYQRNGRHLWLAPDRSRAYVGTTEAVDIWPTEVQPLGCA